MENDTKASATKVTFACSLSSYSYAQITKLAKDYDITIGAVIDYLVFRNMGYDHHQAIALLPKYRKRNKNLLPASDQLDEEIRALYAQYLEAAETYPQLKGKPRLSYDEFKIKQLLRLHQQKQEGNANEVQS